MKNNKFEVGDIIIGKPSNGYSITNNNAILLVVATDYDCMSVRILRHKIYGHEKRAKYYVHNREHCFTLLIGKKGEV